MNQMEAATLYAGLFIIMFVVLKLNAGRVRFGSKVNIGDGGNDLVQKAMRVQANAVEDVPIVLFGLFGLASLSAPTNLIHILGGGFLVFRALHAIGMGGVPGLGIGRLIGTLGTLIVMLATAASCIYYVHV